MSALKSEQESLRLLLVDTVKLLCRNGLRYVKQLQVQGLLAVTIDESDVFVVQISDMMKSDASGCLISAEVSSTEENVNQTDASLNQKTNSISSKSQSHPVHSGNASARNNSPKETSTASDEAVKSVSSPRVVVKQEQPQEDVTVIASDGEDDDEGMLWAQNYSDGKNQNLKQSELQDDRATTCDVVEKKPMISNLPSLKRRQATCVKSEVMQASDINASYIASGASQHQSNDHQEGANDFVTGQGCQDFDAMEGEDCVDELGNMTWNSTVEDYDNDDHYFPDQNLDDDGGDFPEVCFTDGAALGSESFDGKRRGKRTFSVCQYEDCRKVFTHRRNLYRHQRSKHGAIYGMRGQMCFYCTVPACRRVFYAQRTLDKHLRETHPLSI